MDIKEYISSGILETYVLGHCSSNEIAEVEQYMVEYSEIRDEVTSIRNSLEMYGAALSKTPPPALKDKIWNAIEQSESGIAPSAKIIPIASSTPSVWSGKWLVAASFVLLAIASAMNVFLYSKWQSAERQIAEIQSEKEYFASQFQVQQANLANLEKELLFMQHPSTKTILMKGTETHPEALATIFWNSGTREVFLRVNKLPEAPTGKQYQLWAIVDGTPVNAGLVAATDTQFQKMENFATANAFAITLEPVGGSAAPTLDAMFVIGTI